MKITKVEPILLSAPYGAANDAELRRDYPMGKRSSAFVRIETDEGVTGVGETLIGFFVPEIAAQLIAHLGKKLIGRDPFVIAELQRGMRLETSFWTRSGLTKCVISALEIALYDLKGKTLGVPVYDLLGGAKIPRLRLYASGGINKPLDDLAAELESYVEAGFKAVKIRARELQIDKVSVSRVAIGPNVKLIVDMNQSFVQQPVGYVEAMRYAREIAKHDIFFLEEPLEVDDVDGYRRMVGDAPMPISGGETFSSAAEFQRHVDLGCFHIVQPDATTVGGIGECYEAISYAQAKGVDAIPHVWGAGVCVAANVHAAFAAGARMSEWPMLPNPLREEMFVEPFEIKDGALLKPLLPGLGIQLTEELIEKYPYLPGTAHPGKF
jgi:L-alanine-DL-glutamate epimerase-like enolase superfamily enzyme